MNQMITQHRYHLQLKQQQALALYALVDAEFENDGLPVSMYEVNEPDDIWGVAVYADEQLSNEIGTRFAQLLSQNNIDAELECEIIAPTDWVSQTLRELSPVRAGRFLVHGSHDMDAPRPNDIAVRIDAGLAFGTGHHGTTAGCLDLLGSELKRRKFFNPLDLGTGSGVLAIALAKACKLEVLASDIDPVATQVANQNAALNGTGSLVTCVTAAGFNHPKITNRAPYDLVIANILARPLQKLAADFSNNLTPNATVILSGLLPHQQARIVASFQIQGFRFEKSHIRDGWLSLLLRAQ